MWILKGFILSMLIQLSLHSIRRTGFFRMRKGHKLALTPFARKHVSTAIHCTQTCLNHHECHAVNFLLGHHLLCELFKEKPINNPEHVVRSDDSTLHELQTECGHCDEKKMEHNGHAVCDCSVHLPVADSCKHHLKRGAKSDGLYLVRLPSGKAIKVFCDMKVDGGGWIVFQRRGNGKQVFYNKTYQEYIRGFGDPLNEYWLGLKKLNKLTKDKTSELRIDLSTWYGASEFAKYSGFSILGEQDNFKLLVAKSVSGGAGDSLIGKQNNSAFSTMDQDYSEGCATDYQGAWWFKKSECHDSQLNSKYYEGGFAPYAQGLIWKSWKGFYYSMKTTEMKLREID